MRKKVPGIIIGGALLAGLLAAGIGVFVHQRLNRPQPAWFVEEQYAEAWKQFLEESSAPFTLMYTFTIEENLPKQRYGFIISRKIPGKSGWPVVFFPDLADNRSYEEAVLLAADPWMVFRKSGTPQIRRGRVDAVEGGDGALILPGGEEGVVHAWLSQLMQEPAGTFPEDQELWQNAENRLFMTRRFAPGSVNYTWYDAWSLLWKTEGAAWVYAPLSAVRLLSQYQQGLLDATRFPIKSTWHEYGMQANTLWARPWGSEEQVNELADAKRWLTEAATQESIAGLLGWIPVNPRANPYDTIAWEARSAWESSSFIWQEPMLQGVKNNAEEGRN
jgi:hypothetical protein